MIFRSFVVMLIVRLSLVGFAMALVVWLLLQPGYHSATLLASIVLAILVAALWRFVSRTNREVARFLDAVRFADYSQRFDFESAGSGFASLGRTFTGIIAQLRALGVASAVYAPCGNVPEDGDFLDVMRANAAAFEALGVNRKGGSRVERGGQTAEE